MRPLPTGCCGEPPTRDRTFVTENSPKPPASAWAAMPPPKTRPPAVRITRRETKRVRAAYESWIRPDAMLPTAVRKAMAATLIRNSVMIAR